jgi:hypothetical protein
LTALRLSNQTPGPPRDFLFRGVGGRWPSDKRRPDTREMRVVRATGIVAVVSSRAGVFGGVADKKEQMTEGQIDPRSAHPFRGRRMNAGPLARESTRPPFGPRHGTSPPILCQCHWLPKLSLGRSWLAVKVSRHHQRARLETGRAVQTEQARAGRNRAREPPAHPDGPSKDGFLRVQSSFASSERRCESDECQNTEA